MQGSFVLLCCRFELDALVGQPVRVELGEVGVVGLSVQLVVATVTLHERCVLGGFVGVLLQPLLQLLDIGLPDSLEVTDLGEDSVVSRQIFYCRLVRDLEGLALLSE